MLSREMGNRSQRWVTAVVMFASGAIGLGVAAPLSAAEHFPHRPAPTVSRCAGLKLAPHIINIGGHFVAHAGPPASCGGPPKSTTWVWPTTGPENPATIGVVTVHRCPRRAFNCKFRARMFTPPGQWQSICLGGEAPQGAFQSCDAYAVRYGKHFEIGIQVQTPSGQPKTVTLTGHHYRDHVGSDQAGLYEFAVTRGKYTVTFRLGHRTHHRKINVKHRPGTYNEVQIP